MQQRLDTVARGARCALAGQQERVVGSLLPLISALGAREAPPDGPGRVERLILPVVDIVDDHALLDTSHLDKQPDWTYDEHDSGKWPAQRLANHSVRITPPHVTEPPVGGAPPPVLFEGLRESHLEIESAVDRFRQCAPNDRGPIAAVLHGLLVVHLDISQRFLHPATTRIEQDSGEEIMWFPEAHEREALRLLDRIETADEDSAPRLVDELASDVHRYVIEVELKILPLIEANLHPSEQVKLDRAIDAARLRSTSGDIR